LNKFAILALELIVVLKLTSVSACVDSQGGSYKFSVYSMFSSARNIINFAVRIF